MSTDESALASLTPWSSKLFLVTAVTSLAFLLHNASSIYMGQAYPVVTEVIAPAGFLLGVIALFGLYPALAARGAILARVAAAVAVIPAVGWSLLVIGGIGETTGVLPTGGVLPRALSIVVILAMMGTYLLFGITTLREDVYPRFLGLFMLLEAANYALLIAGVVPFLLIDAGHVTAYLGLGIGLLTYGHPADRTEPTTESTAAP